MDFQQICSSLWRCMNGLNVGILSFGMVVNAVVCSITDLVSILLSNIVTPLLWEWAKDWGRQLCGAPLGLGGGGSVLIATAPSSTLADFPFFTFTFYVRKSKYSTFTFTTSISLDFQLFTFAFSKQRFLLSVLIATALSPHSQTSYFSLSLSLSVIQDTSIPIPQLPHLLISHFSLS